MSMYEHILLDLEPPIGRITFNRGDKRNSMIPAMGEELPRAVEELNAQREIRAIIVTGAGSSFSAGGDLDMLERLTKVTPEESRAFMERYYRNYFALQQLEAPSVAMINGPAIGAGLCVALACDLRTIARGAKVGLTFVRVGLNVGMGGTYLLPRLVGWGRATELLLTGRLITADQAFEMGLVNRVCPLADLEPQTLQLASTLAGHAPAALRHTKRSLRAGLTGSLDDVFAAEAEGQSHCYQTQDIHEGVAAVREKRAPRFRGE